MKPKKPRQLWLRDHVHRQRGRCFYCDRHMNMRKRGSAPPTRDSATLDHYIPLGKGGFNVKGNTVAACWQCNNDKGDLYPVEFMAILKGRAEDHQRSIMARAMSDSQNDPIALPDASPGDYGHVCGEVSSDH